MDIGWLGFSQLILLLLGFISIKLTSSMGPAEFGKLALALSVMNFLVLFVYNPLEQTYSRFFFEHYSSSNKAIYVQFLIRTILLLGILAVVCILLVSGILWMLKVQIGNHYFIALTGFYALFMASGLPFQSLINLMKERKIFSLMQIYDKVSQVLGLIGLFLLGLLVSIHVLAVYMIFAAVGLFIRLHYFKKLTSYGDLKKPAASEKNLIEVKMKKEMLLFVAPIFILGLMNWLQTNSERWVIGFSMTTANVGVYFLMWTIANTILSIISAIATQFVNPYIYDKFSDINNCDKIAIGIRYIKYFVSVIAVGTLFMSIGLYYSKEFLIRFISNPNFLNYSALLPIIFIGLGLYNVGQTLCLLGYLLKQNNQYIVPKILSGVITLVAYFCTGKFYGLVGIAFASIGVNIFFIGSIVMANRRILRLLSFRTT